MSQNGLFELVILSLEEELRVHQALFDVVVHEKSALIQSDILELTQINRTKDALLLKLKRQADYRAKVVLELCSELGISANPPRLKTLVSRIGGAPGEKLRLLHESLELVVGRIQEQNSVNSALVQSALMNVQGALKSIKGTLTGNKTYQKKGSLEEKTNSGQLVSKEA